MLALWKGMVKAREEEMANELRHMRPDRIPLTKTEPEDKMPDFEQEQTKSNDMVVFDLRPL